MALSFGHTASSTAIRNAMMRLKPSCASSTSIRLLSSKAPPPSRTKGIGSGTYENAAAQGFTRNRGPVSWPALGLVAVAAASVVTYYKVERERRLENAMGKIVSSESDGWSPNPEFLAKRKWKLTKYGWFPAEDAFGGGVCCLQILLAVAFSIVFSCVSGCLLSQHCVRRSVWEVAVYVFWFPFAHSCFFSNRNSWQARHWWPVVID